MAGNPRGSALKLHYLQTFSKAALSGAGALSDHHCHFAVFELSDCNQAGSSVAFRLPHAQDCQKRTAPLGGSVGHCYSHILQLFCLVELLFPMGVAFVSWSSAAIIW